MTPIEKLRHVALNVNTESVDVAVILTKEEEKELEKHFGDAVKYVNTDNVIPNNFGSLIIYNKKVYIYFI